MVAAIAQEIRVSKQLEGQTIETIYFGGGTPSILTTENIENLLDIINKKFQVDPHAEITMEANPDDIDMEKAMAWKRMGINRFSIGIQSFFEEDLAWMNRAHDAVRSRKCIETILEAGFSNFSIDLIYGTPGQTLEQWKENLDIAIAYKVPHLSCYALTVEEGTALHHQIYHQKKTSIDAEIQSACFEILQEKTSAAGYRHYEISNLALPGNESRHNSSYWKGIHYMGVGPAAHSFDGVKRRWNIANNINYMQAIESGISCAEEEVLTLKDQFNEYIMTALRMDTGISIQQVELHWGTQVLDRLKLDLLPWLDSGKVNHIEGYYILSKEGKFFADGIASSLFQIDSSEQH